MTIAEHCPRCSHPDTRMRARQETGTQTITGWACPGCGHQWSTSYLTAAYADQGDDEDGYWEDPDRWSDWDPRAGW